MGANNRVALIGMLAVVTIVVLGVFVLGDPDDTDAPNVAPIGTGEREETDAFATRAGEDTVGEEEALTEFEPDEAAEAAEPEARAAWLSGPLSPFGGRVVPADPRLELPEDLVVSLREDEPWPRVRRTSTMADLQGLFRARSATSWWTDEPELATTVAADGTFAFVEAPACAWVQVHDAYLFPRPEVRAQPDDREVVVTLVQGAVLAIEIVDGDGEPVSDARVRLGSPFDPMGHLRPSQDLLEQSAWAALPDGTATIRQVPAARRLNFGVTAPGFVDHIEEIGPFEAGVDHAKHVQLVRGASIAGRVVQHGDGGAPATEAEVYLLRSTLSLTELQWADRQNRDTDVDDEGRFRFDDLPPGEYELVVSDPSSRLVRADVAVDVGEAREDVELSLEPGLRLVGRVLTRDHTPIEAARVRAFRPPDLLDMGSMFERGLRASVATDEDGRFEIGGLDEGPIQIEVFAAGYARARLDTSTDAGDVLVQMDATSSISGIAVSRIDGEPVTEYRLRLTPSAGLFDLTNPMNAAESFESARLDEVFANDDGTFELTGLIAGRYDLELRAEGFGELVREDIEVGSGEHVRGVVLMPDREARIVGTLVDARTGLPVADAIVRTGVGGLMDRIVANMAGGGPRTQSDAEGSFELGGLAEGRVSVRVEHPDFEEYGLPEVVLMPGERHDVGTVELSPGATVHGTVYDGDGEPRVGIQVMVADGTGNTMRLDDTDTSGHYEVHGLRAGSYQVVVFDMSFRMDGDGALGDLYENMVIELVELEADEVRRVDLRPTQSDGTRLIVRVRSATGPEAGAMIVVTREGGGAAPRFTQCDDDGRCEIDGLSAGSYLIQAIPSDSAESLQSGSPPTSTVYDTVAVGAGEVVEKVVRIPGGGLRGEVVDARRGTPLEDVRVVLERVDDARPRSSSLEMLGGRVAEAYTASDGTFEFRHLSSGTYDVVAGGVNMLGVGNPDWSRKRVAGIEVEESGPRFTLEIELEAGGTIEGTVRDASGRGLTGVSVWARDGQGAYLSAVSETTTDGSGGYVLRGLETGTWTLVFRGESHALRLVEGVAARAGAVVEHDVTLEPGREVVLESTTIDLDGVQVAVIGPSGLLPTDLFSVSDLVALAARDGGDAARRLELGRLEIGAYEVFVYRDGVEVANQLVSVGAGQGPLVISLP